MKAKALKDSSHLYEVERRARHGERPGFWIAELQISPSQKVPWHCHNKIQDTFYVLEGEIRLFLRDPKEDVRLKPGETYSATPAASPCDQRGPEFSNVLSSPRHWRIRLRTASGVGVEA